MRLLENGSRVRRVRLVTLFIALFATALACWAVSLARSYGLSPGDGGVLRPLGERLLVGGIVLLIALVLLAGIVIYLRRYLIRIELRDDQVELTVIGVLSPFVITFDRIEILSTRYFHGNFSARGLVVRAPWITIKVAGWQIPFVTDMQATHVREEAVMALASKQARAVRALKGLGTKAASVGAGGKYRHDS